MRIGLKISSIIAASVLSLLISGTVAAGAIVCNSIDDDRYMKLTPHESSASCAGSGSGMRSNKDFHKKLGLFEIEKLEGAKGPLVGEWFTIKGLGSTYGSIEFDSDLYSQYSDIHVAFKYGLKKVSPDWMSYSIDNVLDADWWVNRKYALSNVAVWGKRIIQVPEPGTLGLLGLGLIGLFSAIKRGKSIS